MCCVTIRVEELIRAASSVVCGPNAYLGMKCTTLQSKMKNAKSNARGFERTSTT